MTSNQELDNRLLACADFVRKNKICADIGSDHAYLPIYLVKNNICPKAIASDINQGPVERAAVNVRLSGLSDKIIVLLADGLDKASSLSPDDIVIAGMGGELIRDIIAASEYVKSPDIRLILQPMTMPEVLREYLLSSGFEITGEKICSAQGKLYQIICCNYTGITKVTDSFSLLIGEKNLERIKSSPSGDDIAYIKHIANGAKIKIDGRKKSANPDNKAIANDTAIYNACLNILEKGEHHADTQRII